MANILEQPKARPGIRPNAAHSDDGRRVTYCSICEASCGLIAEIDNGRIARLRPDRDNPHSRGHICVKGSSARDLVYDPNRVTTPLRAIDKEGRFEPVGWDEALDDIAQRLIAVDAQHGPEAFAAYIGNPIFFDAFGFPAMLGFFGGLKLSKLFAPMSQDNGARMLANRLTYGSAFRFPLPDLETCDFLIVFGSNMLVSHGSMMSTPRIREQLDAVAARGRVVVVDPRRTETAGRYEHLAVRVDTDVWLLAAMVNILFSEGLADLPFLEAEVEGWKQLRDAVSAVTPSLAAERCGIAQEEIVALTRAFASTPRAAIASRTGICRGHFPTLSNVLVDALNIAGGKFSRPGGSMFGFPLLADKHGPAPERTSRIGGQRTVAGFMPCVVMPHEMLEPGPDRVRACIMVAGNPVISAPGGDLLRKGLLGLDLFVACDLYVNDTNRHADYILPATTFLERPNMSVPNFSNMLAPVIQFADAVIEPIGDVRPEEWIFGELSRRVFGANHTADMQVIVDAMIREGHYGTMPLDGQQGLTLDAIKAKPHGMVLPDMSQEERWRIGLAHDDGKLHLWHDDLADEFARLAKAPAPGPMRLFGRREMRSMNSWLHNVDRLVRSQNPTLLIHPQDARARGITTGMMVEVKNEYGAMIVEAEVSDEVQAGNVNYPHGWGHKGGWERAVAAGGGNVNLLSPTDVDAVERLSGSSLIDGIDVELAVATPN